MAFLGLCGDDEIVKTLRDVFKTNIIQVPEERIKPLTVIAMHSGKPTYWGPLTDMLDEGPGKTLPPPSEGKMADISGRRSKSISTKFGIRILQNFLEGFRLPSITIAAKFKAADTISFSFQDVNRVYMAATSLGGFLKGASIDPDNPANRVFLTGEAKMYLIDSVITSKEFSVSAANNHSSDFSLDIPAIQEIAKANAKVKVVESSKTDISFKNDTPLGFAFSCIYCSLDEAGRISLKPAPGPVVFGYGETDEHTILSPEPEMLALQTRI